jgi:hypothetical protein
MEDFGQIVDAFTSSCPLFGTEVAIVVGDDWNAIWTGTQQVSCTITRSPAFDLAFHSYHGFLQFLYLQHAAIFSDLRYVSKMNRTRLLQKVDLLPRKEQNVRMRNKCTTSTVLAFAFH